MNPENQQPVPPEPVSPISPPQQLSPQHEPTDPNQILQNLNYPLKVMQPGEVVIAHIKPHWVGLLPAFSIAGFMLIVIFGGAAAIPQVIPNLTTEMKNVLFVIAGLIGLLDLIFLWIVSTVYGGNQWVVTSDSITQLSQTGLFFKRTSQMSFENLEDVTFSQKGILPSMLDFGALSAESAGNHSKFVFRYCPQPEKYATQIIAAHEAFMRHQENPTALMNSAGQPTTSS